jgi:hypothetical protein
MKKTLLFFVLTIVGSVAMAGGIDNPTATNRMAVLRSGSTFKVFYKGAAVNKVTVNIYDAKGNKVFSDRLGRVDNFVRPYNFESLQEGAYSFELVDDAGKLVKNVTYSTNKTEKLVALVEVNKAESKFLLVVPSRGKDELNVKIFDDHDTLVYQGVEQTDGDFSKLYDLKTVSNHFTVQVTDKEGATKSIRH